MTEETRVFAALSETEPGPRRTARWTKPGLIESRKVTAQSPHMTASGLAPWDETAVRSSGRDEARDKQASEARFPSLRDRTPEAAEDCAKLMIDREVTIINSAQEKPCGLDGAKGIATGGT